MPEPVKPRPESAPASTVSEASPAAHPDDTAYSVNAIHMVRTALANHVALSAMADRKANILMGVTFLIFTLSVSAFSNGNYRIALLILLLSAFVSAMFAMAAVMPKTSPPKLADDELDNLLFFGVFTGLPQEEFVERMMRRCETDDLVLSTMLRDLHQNGMVLQRKKYRYLSLAFRTFRIGLVLSLIAFMLENGTQILTFVGAA